MLHLRNMKDLLAELCAKPIAELEAMSEDQLTEYFQPVLSLTRPENVITNTQKVSLKVEPAKKKKASNTIEDSLARLPQHIRDKLAELNKQKLL